MKKLALRICITFSAILLAILHIFYPNVKIDEVTIFLLIFSLLPWVLNLFKSIELPGFLKVELQELKEELDVLKGATRRAEEKSKLALISSQTALQKISSEISSDINNNLVQLKSDYTRVRNEFPSGDVRTVEMNKIVEKILKLASVVKIPSIGDLLFSNEEGERLIAYVYLYTQPTPEFFDQLFDSVTKIEEAPFSQYWGLLAIDRNIDAKITKNKTKDMILGLQKFSMKIPKNSDRNHELNFIIDKLKNFF